MGSRDERRKRLERLERLAPRQRTGPTMGDLLAPDDPAWADLAVLVDPTTSDHQRAEAAERAHEHLKGLGISLGTGAT